MTDTASKEELSRAFNDVMKRARARQMSDIQVNYIPADVPRLVHASLQLRAEVPTEFGVLTHGHVLDQHIIICPVENLAARIDELLAYWQHTHGIPAQAPTVGAIDENDIPASVPDQHEEG